MPGAALARYWWQTTGRSVLLSCEDNRDSHYPSVERFHGPCHSSVPYVYGVETSIEDKHEMGIDLLDGWWLLGSA
jgi:hypothetical protein